MKLEFKLGHEHPAPCFPSKTPGLRSEPGQPPNLRHQGKQRKECGVQGLLWGMAFQGAPCAPRGKEAALPTQEALKGNLSLTRLFSCAEWCQ